jgi:replication factor C subunit 3/5
MSEKQLPWIEKYRPIHLNDVVSHTNIIKIFDMFVKKSSLPNMILFGSPGIGKTSIIKACAKQLYQDDVNLMTLEINASEERGIDVVRNTISHFALCSSSFTWNNKKMCKLVILDEADSMTYDAQSAMKGIIDLYSHITRFCLVCNCIKKIHYSIISRCVKLRLHPIKMEEVFSHIKNMCLCEKIDISDVALSDIIKYSKGDMRKIINVLQSISTTYEHISLKHVTTYLNKISTEHFKMMLDSLYNMNIKSSYKVIYNIMNDYGYSLHEFINELNDILLSFIICNEKRSQLEKNYIVLQKISNTDVIRIMYQLGKIEYQIFFNIPLNTLIISLISICNIILKK